MRRLKHAAAAALELDAMIDAMPRRKGKSLNGSSRASLMRAGREAGEMRRNGDWSTAKGRHLVATYAWLHGEVYGVEAEELLVKREWLAACSAADRLARELGSVAGAVAFLRWSWGRERSKALRGPVGRRLTWRLQFCCASLVTDYRVERSAAVGKSRS